MAYSERRLIEYDPVLRRAEWFYWDPDNFKFTIKTEWDVEPIIEGNKAEYAQNDERMGWKGDWHKVASIPMAMVVEWRKNTHNFKDKKALRRLLNDSDVRHFRTRPGRL